MCQQSDKKALAQNFSFNFEKRKKYECHNHIHNPLKTNGNYTRIQQKVGESHLKWRSKSSQVSSLLNLYSDFSITIPFFVKCSKDGKVIYVRIASIKMTSKQKKSVLELGVWVFFYIQYKCYFQFTKLFCSTIYYLKLWCFWC